MTNATPRSRETCEDDGGSELAAMPLTCVWDTEGALSPVAPTYRFRGVSPERNTENSRPKRPLGDIKTGSAPGSLAGVATARSVVARRAIRGLRIYFERLDTVGAGNERNRRILAIKKFRNFAGAHPRATHLRLIYSPRA